jgi:hypothetical protein
MHSDALDQGSDLSDETDAAVSQPATPGIPQTPGRKSPDPDYDTLSSSQKPLTRRASLRSKDAGTRQPSQPLQAPDMNKTKHSRGWVTTNEPPVNIFAETPTEGKRQRKPVDYFGRLEASSSRRGSTGKARSSASTDGRGSASRSPETAKAALPASREGSEAFDEKTATSIAGRKKLNVKLKRKSVASPEVSRDSTTPLSVDEVAADGEIRKTSKRRRKTAIVDASDPDITMNDAAEAGDESLGGKITRSGKNSRGSTRKPKRSTRPKSKSLATSEEEDWSAEEEVVSGVEDMSEDSEKIATKSGRKRKAEEARKDSQDLVKADKAPSQSLRSKPPAKTPATTIPVRDVSAGISVSSIGGATEGSSSTQVPSHARVGQGSAQAVASPGRPAQPPPKAPVRKVQSSSVLSNLLGLGGSTSRTATPNRPRPISNVSATGSPSVRPGQPPTKIAGPDGATKASSLPSRANGLSAAAPTARNSHAGLARQDNPGLEGKHVTAEQVAKERERQLAANAKPRNLFDLLEGAEMMMEFEDETRQRLPTDAVVAKYKLYRPGRTEGIWKLVERMKDERKAATKTADTLAK